MEVQSSKTINISLPTELASVDCGGTTPLFLHLLQAPDAFGSLPASLCQISGPMQDDSPLEALNRTFY